MKYLINYSYYFIIAIVLSVVVIVNISEADYTEASNSADFPVVIIDAGHGGVDGGAVASDGTLEKDINLDIALRLNDILTDKGVTTILTRDGDYSIHDASADTIRKKKSTDLHNRLAIIENSENAIFVSVHQNYYTDSKYSGAQVFYSPNDSRSSLLASCIQQSIVNELQPENTRQIKKSDSSIFLLYKSTIPSVMVECGFLSNSEETEKLKTEAYRQKIAEAVCSGIIKYTQCCSEEHSSAL